MIALLRGSLIEKHPSRVVIDVGGVGYDVQVPLSTFYGLGEPGATVVLRIHTHVREDLIALYGFSTPLEQDLFERLIAISGIGPKLGLAVLSGIEPADLIRAIRTQDVARLTKIPGVGKKTAERIGLELKDRLPQVAIQAAEPARGPGDRKINCATTCCRRWSTSAISLRPPRRPSTASSRRHRTRASSRRCATRSDR